MKIAVMPTPPTSFWAEFFDFVKVNSVPFGIFALLWKAIDKASNYFAQRRKDEMRELIKDEVGPQIDKLSASIDKLHDAIHELRLKK